MAESEPRFSRQLAQDRRRTLIEATIASLKKEGHEGLSVRRIAAEAGVSLGLINHHFPSIDELIAEAYRHFHNGLVASLRSAVDKAPAAPRARFTAFLKAAFSPPTLEPEALTIWVVFWGLYRHSKEIQHVHRETYQEYVALVRSLLSELTTGGEKPRLNLRLTAIGLTAMIDGLWLEWCLDPGSFSPRDAVKLCETWVE